MSNSVKASINIERCIDKVLGTARVVVHILTYGGDLRREFLHLEKRTLKYRVYDLNTVFLRTKQA